MLPFSGGSGNGNFLLLEEGMKIAQAIDQAIAEAGYEAEPIMLFANRTVCCVATNDTPIENWLLYIDVVFDQYQEKFVVKERVNA